ncbi:hypothetical protein SDC9_107368 [bioreactor metagenome]|uniref:Uncharacterized protein n=1 Tax=bioreactor metagenome TaxID=1076179 RepID=A0A645B544_9ZZZZ
MGKAFRRRARHACTLQQQPRQQHGAHDRQPQRLLRQRPVQAVIKHPQRPQRRQSAQHRNAPATAHQRASGHQRDHAKRRAEPRGHRQQHANADDGVQRLAGGHLGLFPVRAQQAGSDQHQRRGPGAADGDEHLERVFAPIAHMAHAEQRVHQSIAPTAARKARQQHDEQPHGRAIDKGRPADPRGLARHVLQQLRLLAQPHKPGRRHHHASHVQQMQQQNIAHALCEEHIQRHRKHKAHDATNPLRMRDVRAHQLQRGDDAGEQHDGQALAVPHIVAQPREKQPDERAPQHQRQAGDKHAPVAAQQQPGTRQADEIEHIGDGVPEPEVRIHQRHQKSARRDCTDQRADQRQHDHEDARLFICSGQGRGIALHQSLLARTQPPR